jgi:hypothetical protein
LPFGVRLPPQSVARSSVVVADEISATKRDSNNAAAADMDNATADSDNDGGTTRLLRRD